MGVEPFLPRGHWCSALGNVLLTGCEKSLRLSLNPLFVAEKTPPLERIDFPTLVDRLSEKFAVADREKLGAFIRGMVAVVLEAVELKTQKKFELEGVQFCLAKSNPGLGSTLKLEVVEKGAGSQASGGVCSVSIKEGDYRGLPDGETMGNDPTQKTPLVPRKRISVIDFKPAHGNTWFSIAQTLKSNNRSKAHLLQLDIQIKS